MHTMYESSKKKRKQGVLGLALLVKMYYDVCKGCLYTSVNGRGQAAP